MNPGTTSVVSESVQVAIRDEAQYLVIVREVRTLAERCDTVEDAKDLADRAASLEVYAERARLGSDMVNRASAAKLWAERRAGELLAEAPKNTGGCPSETGNEREPVSTLAEIGVTKRQSSEWQGLADIPADEFAEAIEVVAEDGPVTAAAVRRAATTATLGSSDSEEWYTPSEYIEAARIALGGIDLDPASCETANKVVKAKLYYSAEQDGLVREWRGRVFMNPPFGRTGSPRFVAKLLAEHEAGNVTAAVIVCAARAETEWFQPLFDHLICFPDHRIRFWRPGTVPAPPFTPAIIYIGPGGYAFTREFAKFGPIVKRVVSHG